VISFNWPEDKKQNAGNASRSLKGIAPSLGRKARIAYSVEDAQLAKHILERHGAIDIKVQRLEDIIPIEQPMAKPGLPATESVEAAIEYRKVRNIDKDIKSFEGKLEFPAKRNNYVIVRGTQKDIHEFLLQLHRDGGEDIRIEFI